MPPPAAPRILLLVQDPDFHALLVDFLPREGFQVVGPVSREQAREIAFSAGAEAIVVECDPHGSNAHLVEGATVPVLTLLGLGESPCLPSGGRHSLTRPVPLRTIAEELRRMLSGRTGA